MHISMTQMGRCHLRRYTICNASWFRRVFR